MLSKFKSIIESDFNSFKGKELFVAISGGKDSMALSYLLLQLGQPHTLLHCNFQLREADSQLDEEFIIDYAKRNNIPVYVQKFNTTQQAKQWRLTIQETARKLRYDWFNTFTKDNNQLLLTAHHQSDAVETFFINLMRGTGIKGLTGIPKLNENIVRPLLSFNISEITKYIDDHNISFRQDLSNFENKYLRNTLRNKLIPQLEQNSPNFSAKVANTINSLNDITLWIEKQAKAFKESHFSKKHKITTVDLAVLTSEDRPFLEFVFKEYGIHRSNCDAFINFLNAQTGAQFKTESYLFTLNRSYLHITPKSPHENVFVEISEKDLPNKCDINSTQLSITKKNTAAPYSENESIQQFDFNKIEFPLTIRNWRQGDKIQPLGMSGTKLISDILINKKIPRHQKTKALILQNQDQKIIAILGIQISDVYKISTSTKQVLQIIIR